MNDADKTILQKIANTVRVISAEGVEKANSGHPGLPMGCAEIGAYLFAKQLPLQSRQPGVGGARPLRPVGRSRVDVPLLATAPERV